MTLPTKFNLEDLRLSQDFASQVGVKKALLTVPVRKPNRQEFVRTHPDPNYRFETALLELKSEREMYVVAPHVQPELPGELIPMVLFMAITRQGVLFLWSIRLPGPDGRHDPWNRSALEAAQLAMTQWVRVASDIHLGAYEVSLATGALPEPEWPAEDFEHIFQVAFKDRYIDSVDHPAVRRLRGDI